MAVKGKEFYNNQFSNKVANKKLFDEFDKVSAKAWKQKIQVDLQGADYNDSLVWESSEGIKVKPFYHSDDSVLFPKNVIVYPAWSISQTIYTKNAEGTNEKALSALESGVESLSFVIPSEEVKSDTLLKGIDLKPHSVQFKLEFLSKKYIETLLGQTEKSLDTTFLNLDPIGHLAETGSWFHSQENDFNIIEEVAAKEECSIFSINMGHYQNAGANMVQQLAYALGHANEYLNTFPDVATRSTRFNFKVSVGTNYFFEIAKLRALRLLWDSLMEVHRSNAKCHITAYPTERNKTLYSYNTNMLRSTVECMSAVLGGADCVTNLPYDAIYHKDNEFAERIALNQLLLLKNESYFDQVLNAADGAYYIESITGQLAEKALILFKDIEHNGGFLKQLKANTIQRKIAESAAKEQKRFDTGEEVLVGTNKYRNDNDKMKDTIELYPFLKTKARKTLIPPILKRRLAEELEQKRLKNE